MLDRGVVEGAVAGAVGDHRYRPVRRQDVHVAGAGLELEDRAAAGGADADAHGAGQRSVLLALVGHLAAGKVELERRRGVGQQVGDGFFGRQPRRQPQVEEEFSPLLGVDHRVHFKIAQGVLHLVEGAHAGVETLGPGADRVEIIDQFLGGIGLVVGGVEVVFFAPHPYQEPPLVPQGDPLPAGRLADDDEAGLDLVGHVTGSLGARGLLLGRAHQVEGKNVSQFFRQAGGGQNKGYERPLGVHRATAEEFAGFDAHRHLAGNGVDVAQKGDVQRTPAPDAAGVVGLVDPGLHSQRLHAPHQVLSHQPLLARGAGDLQRPGQKAHRVGKGRVLERRQGHASTSRTAFTTCSRSDFSMTSGGKKRMTVGPAARVSTWCSFSSRVM